MIFTRSPSEKKMNVILAMTSEGGIGLKGGMPWKDPAELGIFRKKTMGTTLIMGRKTVAHTPKLIGRNIVCVCKENPLDRAIQVAKSTGKQIFVAGGAVIYRQIFDKYMNDIKQVHLSVMVQPFECDTYIDFDWTKWVIRAKEVRDTFTHYVLEKRDSYGESQYLGLLDRVLQTTSRIGRNGETLSSFGEHLKFDLRNGFPLLTTKKMFLRGIVEELLFFIRGQTDTTILEAKNVNIWKGNTSREFLDSLGDERSKYKDGEMGPMYGYQWRRFNATPENKGVDQLAEVVQLIKTDPHSRRIMMTDYNPCQVKQGVLYPCHSIILQFYVSHDETHDYLDMFCYNRSSDLFLGLPFNIASSSLLLILIATACNLVPRFVNISLGDAHIYAGHIDQAWEQSRRVPYSFPTLTIKKPVTSVEDMENLEWADFAVENYQHHPAIEGKMVA